MAKRYRAADPPEFRRQIMELHRAGHSVRDLAREFEPSFDTIADRVRQAGLRGVPRRRGMVNTRRDPQRQAPHDLVRRNFRADGPDQFWIAAIA